MRKRITAALLALLIILSTATLSSCSTGQMLGKNESSNGSNTADTETVRTHSVPKQDFEGEEFHSLCYEMNTSKYYYFTDEEASGDPIKEALWQRNELIVDQLNCSLTYDMQSGAKSEGVANVLYDDIVAGGDSYQQVVMHTIFGVASIVSNGYAYDFSALPHVNLEADWWDLEDMEALRLGRIYPYGRSDFVISAPHVVTFNRDMIDAKNMESPYDLVNEGTWTLDKFIEMASSVAQDVNHDARYTSEEDIFGVVTSEISKFNSFLTSCDQPVSKRGEDGRLELALNTEKTVKIIERFYDLQLTGGAIHIDMNEMRGVYMDVIFGEGRALFALYDLSFLELLREHDVEYGIVPYPKFDEAQTEYRSQDWGPMWMIPAQIKNPELVGSVVELESFYSRETIVPAYYDKVLEGKLTNDTESRRMLDVIFESVSFEPINNYFGFQEALGDLAFVVGCCIDQGNKNFASYYREFESTAKTMLRQYYENLAKNGGI